MGVAHWADTVARDDPTTAVTWSAATVADLPSVAPRTLVAAEWVELTMGECQFSPGVASLPPDRQRCRRLTAGSTTATLDLSGVCFGAVLAAAPFQDQRSPLEQQALQDEASDRKSDATAGADAERPRAMQVSHRKASYWIVTPQWHSQKIQVYSGNLGGPIEPGRSDAVAASFIFFVLLEGDANCRPKGCLGHPNRLTALPDTLSNIGRPIGRISSWAWSQSVSPRIFPEVQAVNARAMHRLTF